MSSIMRFNLTDEVEISGANGIINAETAGPVSDINLGYEVALVLLANGLEGTYNHATNDFENVVSNLSIDQDEFNRGRVFLATGSVGSLGGASGTQSTYGSGVTATLKYGTGAATAIQLQDGSNLTISGSNFESEHIGDSLTPLGNSDTTFVSDSGSFLKAARTNEIGHALKHVIAAAMFKDLGKTTALIKEDALATSVQNKLYTALEAALEDSAGYNDSKVFKQYMGTSRYGGSDPAWNGSEDYNLNDTVVNFVVNIQGSILDEDNSITMNASVVSGLFGDSTADETKVTSDGTYNIRAWVQWFNDIRY